MVAGQQGADPRVTVPDGPTARPHVLHRGNAKHLQSPAHIWEAAVPSADRRQRHSARPLGRRCA